MDTRLQTMLENFLSTTTSQEAWAAHRADKQAPVEWTRFKQKALPQESVFVNGVFHNGAHMNLMVWTVFPKARRSKESLAKIRGKRNEKSEKYILCTTGAGVIFQTAASGSKKKKNELDPEHYR